MWTSWFFCGVGTRDGSHAMMKRTTTRRRFQKAFTVFVILLDLVGARVITADDAGERSRIYFGPTLGVKAIAKAIAGQPWKQHAAQSITDSSRRHSSRDIQTVRREDAPAVAPFLPQFDFTQQLPDLASIQPLLSRSFECWQIERQSVHRE